MELTEFIEARLAAEEGDADRVHDIGCHIHPGFADERDECNCGDPARVLAQVAAMRAIVVLLTSRERQDDSEEGLWHKIGYDRATFDVLRHFAAIWRDHDDYDPAWSPDA